MQNLSVNHANRQVGKEAQTISRTKQLSSVRQRDVLRLVGIGTHLLTHARTPHLVLRVEDVVMFRPDSTALAA
jgi:hypothetical protein